jgi:UDP-2,3-diacylglucosamine hydrolase
MKQRVLLISDLHLPTGPSPLREAFRRFIEGPARDCESLYILGDLFEYWIGDDIGLQDYAPEIELLAGLTRSGTKVFFQHGNRDFLVGRDFSRRTGVEILPDPVVVDFYGTPTLLSHGDLFCTDDVGYQRWRRFAHNRIARRIFLAFPRRWREKVAGGVRGRSDEQKQYKPQDIMDVNAAAVESAFVLSKTTRLIHGHTHRPADHEDLVDERHCERLVLADWRPGQLEALELSPEGSRRIPLPA